MGGKAFALTMPLPFDSFTGERSRIGHAEREGSPIPFPLAQNGPRWPLAPIPSECAFWGLPLAP
jgi:hypothetical protein